MGKNGGAGERIRYNMITTITYIVGIILLIQLFNLQIIHGAEYRETSNSRLTRESIVKAARGSIKDRTGVDLVNTDTGYSVEIYSTKVDDEGLNTSIQKFVQILESNKDEFVDNLPIKVEPFEFTIESEEEQKSWKKNNNIDENYNAEQVFYYLKNKYKITADDLQVARKIMAVRYEISRNGYSSTRSVTIAKNISDISAVQIREQNASLAGMNVVTEPTVSYKSGNLASHVLGYVGAINKEEYETRKDTYRNDDIIGKSGIQKVFEEYLKGTDGIKQVDMTVDGAITSEYISEEAVAGSDVVLTIDANLQKVAEDALKQNIEDIAAGKYGGKKHNADAGAVVVMNVNTGEVLAMASYPDYNPERYSEEYSADDNSGRYNNRAISSAQPPGSTFKMAVATAALAEGKITPTTKINDTGVYPYGHHPACWYYRSYRTGHGYLNVTQAIKYSCNYFFYEMGYRLGIDKIAEYAQKYGLGKRTGIELEGEASGTLASTAYAESIGYTWYLSDTLSAAIGQSYNNFTPIQMARYVSMLANGGKNIDVSIVKSIINPDGTEVSKEEIDKFVKGKLDTENEVKEDIEISKENLDAIKKGMRGVTSEAGGTAYSTFADFDMDIAGKTGSAQVIMPDGKEEAHGWFVGFAPYDKPEIAVVVLVEKASSGGYTASVAKAIMEEYFGMNAEEVTEDKNAQSGVESVR